MPFLQKMRGRDLRKFPMLPMKDLIVTALDPLKDPIIIRVPGSRGICVEKSSARLP